MAEYKGFLKDANGNIVLPGTSADKVSMSDASGAASTVLAEIVKNRQQLTEITGLSILQIKGVANTEADLSADAQPGWLYVIGTAGTYKGQTLEVGDVIFMNADSEWNVVQANLVNAVKGPDASTAGNLATFNNGTGSELSDSGVSIADVQDAIDKRHTHENKDVLDKLGENDGVPTYDGAPLGQLGIPVVENGAEAPANLAEGALYFEKDAVI